MKRRFDDMAGCTDTAYRLYRDIAAAEGYDFAGDSKPDRRYILSTYRTAYKHVARVILEVDAGPESGSAVAAAVAEPAAAEVAASAPKSRSSRSKRGS